jgi:predicted  nucleic acid-binding Zn-ribbon protein
MKTGIAFCWNCDESLRCDKWNKHRQFSQTRDSFVCYQKLEDNIRAIQEKGMDAFEQEQITRETLLKKMLQEYNAGRSKTLYCIAATV